MDDAPVPQWVQDEARRLRARLEENRIDAVRMHAKLEVLEAMLHGHKVETPTLGPSDAILDLVAAEPGLAGEVIIDRLEHKVVTDASNVRRMLRQTLQNLLSRGKVQRDGQGGWVVAK